MALAGSHAVHLVFGFELVEHVEGRHRALLQVGVDEAQAGAPRPFQAGVHRGLFAEVAREQHGAHGTTLFARPRHELAQARRRRVRAAIVHEDDLQAAAAGVRLGKGRLVEGDDIVLLVESRDDEGEVRGVSV